MRLTVTTPWSTPEQTPFGDVIRTKARSFAFASRFLIPERRRATEVLYAFFRTVDDLVDEPPPGTDPALIRHELRRWERHIQSPASSPLADDPLARALTETVERYAIPPAYFLSLLRGLEDDLDGRAIATEDDLERYAFRVAATVGLAMCHVLEATSRRALAAATALGIAMQLTNIIRDVSADLAGGRCYFSWEQIERFPGARAALDARRMNEPLRALLREQIGAARSYYRAGLSGLAELPPDARFPIAVAADLYSRILDVVERRDCDVFAGRAALGRHSKVLATARLALAMRARSALGRGIESAHDPAYDPAQALGPAARAELAAAGAPPVSTRLLQHPTAAIGRSAAVN